MWTAPRLVEKAAERDRARAAIAAGKEHAERLTSEAAATVERLTSILVSGLARPVELDLTAMLRQRIEAIRAGLQARDRESVQAFLEMVLARTLLPDDVPDHIEVAYSPQGEQALVRFELPSVEVVPAVGSWSYVVSTLDSRSDPT